MNSNTKLILGFIWQLIQHYSDDEKTDQPAGCRQKKRRNLKKKLLEWLQATLPTLKVVNFTKDWNNGKAIGALVNAQNKGNLQPGIWCG